MLKQFPDATVGVLDEDVLQDFSYVRKDIRALNPSEMVDILTATGREARLLGRQALKTSMHSPHLIMPDDDISRNLAHEHNVSPDFYPVFLRWHRENVNSLYTVNPDRIVTYESSDRLIAQLFQRAHRSPSWWRAVAAAVEVDETTTLLKHNVSVPTEYTSSIDGDPSILRRKGEHIDIVADIHAEAAVVAEAARTGISLEGKSIYVTTFPCATCAKLIAETGIARCYYVEGYANLDGETILKANGVELIKIITNIPDQNPQSMLPYPKKPN